MTFEVKEHDIEKEDKEIETHILHIKASYFVQHGSCTHWYYYSIWDASELQGLKVLMNDYGFKPKNCKQINKKYDYE